MNLLQTNNPRERYVGFWPARKTISFEPSEEFHKLSQKRLEENVEELCRIHQLSYLELHHLPQKPEKNQNERLTSLVKNHNLWVAHIFSSHSVYRVVVLNENYHLFVTKDIISYSAELLQKARTKPAQVHKIQQQKLYTLL